jgi:xanthine dehydrogenase large subunit
MFAVVAETNDIARRAARLAKVDYESCRRYSPQAKRQKSMLPRCTRAYGDPGPAMAAAPRRMGGEFVGGQEQFYLEGQISHVGRTAASTSTAPRSTRRKCSTSSPMRSTSSPTR